MSYASDALTDAQEREIERLEAENDGLKAKVLWLEVTLIKMAYERCGAHAHVSEAGNGDERLRELVAALLTSHDGMCTQLGSCFGCRFFDASRSAPACPFTRASRAARELGIEVRAHDPA